MSRRERKAEEKRLKVEQKAEEKAREQATALEKMEQWRAKADADRFTKLTTHKGYRADIALAMIAAEKEGSSFLGVGRAVGRLTDLIPGTEKVEALVAVQYAGGSGVGALTDERFIAVRDDMGKRKVESVRRAGITNVSWSSGVFGGITIQAGTTKLKVGFVNEKQGLKLVDLLNAPPDGAPSDESSGDVADRLRTLTDLREQGLVSDEEYAARRAAILDRL